MKAQPDGLLKDPAPPAATRIVWVEDHEFVTESGAARLREAGFNVVGVLPDGDALLDSFSTLQPDLVLCDVTLPGELDGIAVTEALLSIWPSAKVVMFSADIRGPLVVDAILAGAIGYLDKTLGVSAVVDYLKKGASGQYVFDQRTTANFIETMKAAFSEVQDRALSPRDETILALLVSGVDTNGIASRLQLSVRTAKRALTQLYQALGVKNRREAVSKAGREGLVPDVVAEQTDETGF
jgi:DNA-binding NarL/FixJ family response regulator